MLHRYVRDNDDKALRRQAERIHLQSSSSANATSASNTVNTTENAKSPTNSEAPSANNTLSASTADGINVNESGSSVKVEQKGNTSEAEKNVKDNKNGQAEEDDDDDYPIGDSADKLWDDVDKDLGDILRETEAGTKSSDDEDSRYDRFRNSDKKQQHSGKDKERDNEKSEVDEKETIKKQDPKVKLEKIDM